MSITNTLFSADELLRMPEDGYRYELVKGELIRMASAGSERGTVAIALIRPNISKVSAQYYVIYQSGLTDNHGH